MESLEQSVNFGLISCLKMIIRPSVGLLCKEDDSDSDSSEKNTKAIIYESADKAEELEDKLSDMGYDKEDQKKLQKTCENYGPILISPSAGIFPLFPPYDVLIKEAISALGGGKGARRLAIIKYIASKEKYLTKSSCTKGVGLALKRMTRSGFLYHSVRGTYLMTPKGKLLSYTKGTKFSRKVCYEKSQKKVKRNAKPTNVPLKDGKLEDVPLKDEKLKDVPLKDEK